MRVRWSPYLDAQRVEEGVVAQRVAEALEAVGEGAGQLVDALRDAAQALGAVVDRVHARHDGEQHLRRADVAGRLLAADVLLAGLQRHAQRGLAARVIETPMMRPGMWRTYSSRVAKKAACGPP